ARARRRPETGRAPATGPRPPRTRPTASAGGNGLPVLASDVAAAALPAGFEKLSPSTWVGTLLLVTAPVCTVVVVVPLLAVVVVVVPLLAVVVVVPLLAVVVVDAGGHRATQMTLCFSPPGKCTVMKMWKPCCGL